MAVLASAPVVLLTASVELDVVKVVLACLIGLVGWGVTRYRRGLWPSLVSTALLVAVAATRTFRRFVRQTGPNRPVSRARLSDPRHRSIVAPNRDTSTPARSSLRGEPVRFECSPVDGWYSSVQLMDMWTESFAYVGTRRQ